MRIRSNHAIILQTLVLIILFGCQKELKYDINNPPVPPTTIWKTTGVTGQVIDPTGVPVSGAEVKFGSGTVQTDKNGYFSFANASFSTSEAFVVVKKAGYFTGSRTFYPRQGSNNYTRIQLMPKHLSGNVDAASGGSLTLVSGMTIEFPANGIATAAGSSYSGDVSVSAAYLDPTSNDINERMPGDLRGTTTAGQQQVLKSFGMIAVELNSPSGQSLNMKAGSKATLRFPIPASLSGSAPATIPLWYFDETSGLWKEEGAAINQGSEYVGEVNHFSFWNVDVPSQFVRLSVKIISPDGNPVEGAKVKITSLADGTSAYDYTDNTGYVEGAVPKNKPLKIEVFDNCDNVVLSQNIGPFTTDTDLSSLQVNTNVPLQTIYGTARDCNGNALSNGVVMVILNNTQSEFATITNGGFSITFLTCTSVSSAQLVAIDESNQQQGNPVTIQLTSTNVNAGQLQACGVAINTFFNATVDGVSNNWTAANSDLLFAFEDSSDDFFFPNTTVVGIVGGDTLTNWNLDYLSLRRPNGNVTVPAQWRIDTAGYTRWIFPDSLNDYYPINPNLTATITAYGPVGQFIEGNISGQFGKFDYWMSSFTDTVTISASFRVRRISPWW